MKNIKLMNKIAKVGTDIFDPAVFKKSSVVHYGFCILHIYVHSRGYHSRFGYGELKLIYTDGLLNCSFEKLYLHGVMV